MTRDKDGTAVNRGGASSPTGDELDRELDGIAGNVAAKGEKPSPGDRDRGETSSNENPAPIDVDSAHDRAS